MDILLLAARLTLASVFLVSGLAKILDQPGTREAARNFGTPGSAVRLVGLLLPVLEIAVALALIPLSTVWYGAIGASALLALFSAVIAVNLLRGNTPDCHCFGQLHSEPIGQRTLLRNGALAAVAVLIVLARSDGAGLSVSAWIGRASLVELLISGIATLLLVTVAVLAWLMWQLLQQNGRILSRLNELERVINQESSAATPPVTGQQPSAGLPVGTPAPEFHLPGISGETLTRNELISAGKPAVLLFSDPACGPCNALLPSIRQWQRDHDDTVTVAVITRGSRAANQAKAGEHEIRHMLLQRDREVASQYQARGTPSAVVVRPDGTIGSPLAQGSEAIKELIGRTARQHPGKLSNNGTGHRDQEPAAAPVSNPVFRIGQPAPAIDLPDLQGSVISLEGGAGTGTLVLFWNPGCGFCQRILEDVKAREERSGPGQPGLLIVSSGSPAANQAMGLTSPIVLDEDGAFRRLFGVRGTPSGILIDRAGSIASELAVGAPAVLGLVKR